MSNNMFAKPSGRATDSALIDSMKDSASSRASTTEVIEIHKRFLRPDRNQPRKHFDQEVLDRRRQQLEEDGQKSPITVFPGVRGDDGELYYDIEDGECRWRSVMQSDKIDYLRAEIDTETDRNDLATIRLNQLLHNDDGSEPLTPIERAFAYREIVEHLETQGEESPKSTAAKKLGLSLSAFSEVLSLANLPEDLAGFALEQGVSDAKVLNGMVQVHKRGDESDLATLKAKVAEGLERGENLRGVVRDLVVKVKAKTSGKKTAGKGKTAAQKKEKPARTLTARDINLRLKDDGSGVVTVETARETVRVNLTPEQVEQLLTKTDGQ